MATGRKQQQPFVLASFISELRFSDAIHLVMTGTHALERGSSICIYGLARVSHSNCILGIVSLSLLESAGVLMNTYRYSHAWFHGQVIGGQNPSNDTRAESLGQTSSVLTGIPVYMACLSPQWDWTALPISAAGFLKTTPSFGRVQRSYTMRQTGHNHCLDCY